MRQLLCVACVLAASWAEAAEKADGRPGGTAANGGTEDSGPAGHGTGRPIDPPDDREPEIAEVQRAAARTAGFDLGRAASWKRRAANTAWLPEVSVRAKKESFSNDGERFNTESPYQTFVVGEGVFFEVSARWSLDALVFDRKELDASREAGAVFADYRKLMEEVGRLYFARRALLSEMAAGGLAAEQAAAKKLKADEITAMLDALSGGFFSRELSKKKRNSEVAK
ncbi:MAG: hypothetical protein HY897_11995 [Deltaproteobacteria bacterium]|nr:hypothetical protein [Deltaproteobacteria bacterium]